MLYAKTASPTARDKPTTLLVRVAADSGRLGGFWNGPVDSRTGEFVYVPIPEVAETRPGLETRYAELSADLARFNMDLPLHLVALRSHLDPDFRYATYGDSDNKATRIRNAVTTGDQLVFYAGLRDIHPRRELVYAIIGLIEVREVVEASLLRPDQLELNAHGRIVQSGARDVVVFGRAETSGRLASCIPIGCYRDGAYRVEPSILDRWGGISASNGYLQRSAVIPSMLNPASFLSWLEAHQPTLLHTNN